MKHKHYDMIVAKANNFELIQFIKIGDDWEIVGSHDNKVVSFASHYEYFLCLPQHKEACLHWLNGGDIQVSGDGLKWESYDLSPEHPKYPMTDFTGFEFQFRIKPKKEKRWIGVYKNGATTDACLLKKEAKNHPMITDASVNDWQFIEIEVEV
ncbi:hypothetical protein NVP1173O_06 [Vibrio phage 1.173.O._10N.261.55.A11]|nr:hypothetical protein NVP1173O_06 [Vibrio phage 1.173.O._10N.261.55.A11]